MAKPKKPQEPKKPEDYHYKKCTKKIGDNEDGTPIRKTFYGKTMREAEAKRDEYMRKHNLGIQDGELTVREWSERWKKSYKTNVSEEQKQHYNAKLQYDILPVIGDKQMRSITLEDLQSLMNSYEGGKKGTVEKIKRFICILFADAEDARIIERNPAARLTMPTTKVAYRRQLTKDERTALLEVAKTHQHGAFILTLLYTGIRRGECLALLRSDVDLEKKRINITKAIRYKGNKPNLGDTKGNNIRKSNNNTTTLSPEEAALGHRVLPIPDLLLPVLIELCANKAPDDILFPKTEGKYATHIVCENWWRSIKRHCHIAAGAQLYRNAVKTETSKFADKISMHYLRHTYATDLKSAKVDRFTRASFMGHSPESVTDNYTKLEDEAIDHALELMNTHLNKL
jgi:integrase